MIGAIAGGCNRIRFEFDDINIKNFELFSRKMYTHQIEH